MNSKRHFRNSLLAVVTLWSFLMASLPVGAQSIVPSNIAGGSTKYVIVGLKKKPAMSARRSSRATRTIKQRSSTRSKVVRQSQAVAVANRDRRNIKEVTPEEYSKLNIKLMPKDQASKVLAGAGEYYVKRDDVDSAVEYLEGAVNLDPSNKDAKLALSEVYTTLGDRALVRADQYAQLAAKSKSENDSANETKNSRLSKIEIEKAEKYYQAGVDNDPDNASAYVGLGQFYDAQDKDDLAKKNYEKALELDPGLTEVKGPLGIIYFQEGEIAKAEKLIQDASAADPDNAETQFFLGLIRYKQGRDEEARAALEKSVSIDGESAESHYYLGATYNRIDGMADSAIAQFEKAVELDPRFYQAWFDLGVAYINKGDYEKAIDAFQKAIDSNPDQTDEQKRTRDESYANLADAYRQDGKIDLAISKYRIAVSRVKDDPELFTTYGFAQAERGNWLAAVNAFKSASDIAPNVPSATTNLGWAHYKAAEDFRTKNMKADEQSQLATAKTLLEKAVAQYDRESGASKESKAAANYYLGVVLNHLGQPDRAIDVLEKANDLSNDKWAAAVYEEGVSYTKRKNYSKAIKQFKKALDVQKDYPDALYGLGEAQYLNGNEKEARKIQRKLEGIDKPLAARLARLFFEVRIG